MKALRQNIWDVSIRCFHWLLVFSVSGSFVSVKAGMLDWHQRFGFLTIGLLVFRVLWGIWGGETARFVSFIRGPKAVWAHVKELRKPGPLPFESPGHNPAGAVFIVLVLFVLLIQGGLGLFTNDGILFQAPLARLVSEPMSEQITAIHHKIGKLLIVMVLIHIGAVVFYWLFKKRNLITPMITGSMRLKPGESVKPVWTVSPWRAVLAWGVAVFAVFYLFTL